VLFARATTGKLSPGGEDEVPAVLHRSDEGLAVSLPGLLGCSSQGATEQEALANLADAIRKYVAVLAEQP
jgi:predicted RNase H-like HicB family nuclease